MNMKNAIQTSFELFPDADKMVVLEDDLYVSPDFVRSDIHCTSGIHAPGTLNRTPD